MRDILKLLAAFCGLWILVGICLEIGSRFGDWLCR